MTMPIDNRVQNTLKAMHLFNSQLFHNDEMEFGSNTMLFGTNGVGKTTTLSLLAFFATGNQLLFRQEKHQNKSFYDYFFAKNNSFIVYEYEKEEHNVLVAIYTKEGVDKLEFRFVAMEKDCYSVEDIFNRDTREEILNEIDKLSISSAVVSQREYLKVLYGDSKKENSIYMYSHVRNYRTFAKLHYASFKNIAIDSTSIKNIILEYAYSKDDMSRNGVSLEKHGDAIISFQSDHSAIMEWKKNYHTIESLRASLLSISTYEKRKIDTLMKISREWSWYVKLIQDTRVLAESKRIAKKQFDEEEWPHEKMLLINKLKSEQKNLNDLKSVVTGISKKKTEYSTNVKLMVMINELPLLSQYKNELKTSRDILSSLQEKNKSESEKHSIRINALKEHFESTIKENTLFLTEQKGVFLAKKISEDKDIREAEDKVRAEFSNIDNLKGELSNLETFSNGLKLEEEKLKLKKFSDEERSIVIEGNINLERKKQDGITIHLSSLKEKEDDLERREEAFISEQRRRKEENRLATDKALQKVRDEIEKLNTLSHSNDTLYSQIEKSGLDVKKYTSVLKFEALHSEDFTLNLDARNSGMQIFDFELAKDTELVESGETLYQNQKNLDDERENIKSKSKKALATLENEYSIFFVEYRKEWALLKEERESINASAKEITEVLESLHELKTKAEESWKKQQKVLMDNISDKLIKCGSSSSDLREEVKILDDNFKNTMVKIRENPYDEKGEILAATKAYDEKNKEAEDIYNREKAEADELYSNILSDSGVSGNEVAKYTKLTSKLEQNISNINEWKMKIREYESFLLEEWAKYEGLLIDLKQKTKSLEKLESETDVQLNTLSQKSTTLENELKELNDKISTLEAKNNLLLRQVEAYSDDLEGIEPLVEKTEQEKEETDFKFEADELLSTLNSTIKILGDEKESITKKVSHNWGTFIAKGVLLFTSDPIENARKIVSADNADEMGVFTDKAYQSINLSINAVATHYSILHDAYGTVKDAIRRINKDLEDIGSTTLIESIKLRAKDKHSGIDESMRDLAEYWKMHSDNMQQNLFSTDNSSKHKEVILDKLKDFLSKLSGLSNKEKNISVGSLFDLQGKIIEKGNESDWEDGAFGKGSEGTRVLIKVAITASLFSMALSGSKDKQTPLLLIDEIGKLHNDNVQRVLEYINKKGSYLVAVQPNNVMAKFFDKAYLLDEVSKTQTSVIKYLRRKVPLKMKDE